MGNKEIGWHTKFKNIERVDNEHLEGGKHFNCTYFVLDITHDKHSIAALIAYAESCKKDGYELLANDIMEIVKVKELVGYKKVDEISVNEMEQVGKNLEELTKILNRFNQNEE